MKKVYKWLIWFISTMLIAWLGNYFYDQTNDIPVLKFITGTLNWLYDAGISMLNYQVKVWIVLVALATLIGLLALYIKFKTYAEVPPPDFTNYKIDVFKRWTWRWDWQWTGKFWTPTNLIPYCPKDDVQLIDQSSFMGDKKFYCPKCETTYHEYYEPVEWYSDAEVLILDKVNKKTYPKK